MCHAVTFKAGGPLACVSCDDFQDLLSSTKILDRPSQHQEEAVKASQPQVELRDAAADAVTRDNSGSKLKSSTTSVEPKSTTSSEEMVKAKPSVEVKAQRELNGDLNIKVSNNRISKCFYSLQTRKSLRGEGKCILEEAIQRIRCVG